MRFRTIGLVVTAGIASIPRAGVAQGRNAQITAAQQAYDEFDLPRAQQLLRTALNPALGPADSVWGRGVQLLNQILVEGRRDSLAAAWSRWANRLAPTLTIDSINFLPEAVASFTAARTFGRRGSPGDSATRTTWEWPVPASTDTRGQLRVLPSTQAQRLLVIGVGLATPGQPLSLAPGSYDVEASATGLASARVTREVLPGVTTVLTFTLSPPPPLTVARAPVQQPQPQPTAPTPTPKPATPPPGQPTSEQLGIKKKGGFPVAVVILGVAAAGGAACALAVCKGGGGGSGPPGGGTPGSILISIPNPN